MEFFTRDDFSLAVSAMLDHISISPQDKKLLGTMSGIKRRARARELIDFAQHLDPAPPDATITSMRWLLRQLFSGRAVANTDLHRHFATPGRKADDRVDMAVLSAWLEEHRPRLMEQAAARLAALEDAWKIFTADAARKAGRLRRANPPAG